MIGEEKMTNNIVDRRRESLFLYDVTDSNPNGDPDNENLPRMDLDGYNIVTDVRLKRTIRDYWLKTKQDKPNMQVLIRRVVEEKNGSILNMENLVYDALKETKKTDKSKLLLKIMNDLPTKFIDIRCFGAAITVKGANHSFTGPMQFAIGKSLNKPTISTHTITTTFGATGEDKRAGTFGAFHIVDYSLLLFHGLLCEQNAKATEMTENDLINLYEGLWYGTKLLNTRSKFNHIPRLLLSVVSKEKEFQIGGLDKLVSLVDESGIKGITEVKIQLKDLIERLEEYKDDIEKIELITGNDLQLYFDNTKIDNLGKYLKDKGFSVVNPLE